MLSFSAFQRYRISTLYSIPMRSLSTESGAKIETDICIVGCGPVGMTLASILHKFNKKCLIIEKGAQL